MNYKQRTLSPTPRDRKETGWAFSVSDSISSVLGGGKQDGKQDHRQDRVDMRVDLRELMRLTKKEPIYDEKTIKSLLSIWNQSLCSLPSFKDVPRLAKRTRILRDGVLILGCDTNDMPKWKRTLQVLICLAQHLCPPEVASTFKQRILAHHFDPSMDVSECLHEFFEQEEGKGKKDKEDLTLAKGSRLNGVLKAINQDIIFPVYRLIRNAFYEKFPFKDVHLSWSVDVNILSNGKVEVFHTKKQQSHSTKSTEYFGFEWTLKMVLNADVTNMEAFFAINRDWFTPLPEAGKKDDKQPPAPSGGGGEPNSAFKNTFRQVIKEFTGKTYPPLMVIDRPLSNSNVRSCLPRLAANCSFVINGRHIYAVQRGLIRSIHPVVKEHLSYKTQGQPSDPTTLLFSFLYLLCHLTGDDEAERVVTSNKWWASEGDDEFFNRSGDDVEKVRFDNNEEEEEKEKEKEDNSISKKALETFLTFLLDRELKSTRKFGEGVERWRVERELAGEGEGLEEVPDSPGGESQGESSSPSSINKSLSAPTSSAQGRVDLLLRVCDFDLMWGGAQHLRNLLYPLCRYRDVKGSWSVQFIFDGKNNKEVDLDKLFFALPKSLKQLPNASSPGSFSISSSSSPSTFRPRTPPPPRSSSPPPTRSTRSPIPSRPPPRPTSPRVKAPRNPSVPISSSSSPSDSPSRSSPSSYVSSSSFPLGPPIVLLERKERSQSVDESEYFEFVWGQSLMFRPSLCSVADAEFFVKEYHFNQTTKGDVRGKVRSILDPLQRHSSLYPNALSYGPSGEVIEAKDDLKASSNDLQAFGFIECLRALRSSLANQQELEVKLPRGDDRINVQALSLLDAMDEALSGAPVPNVRIQRKVKN